MTDKSNVPQYVTEHTFNNKKKVLFKTDSARKNLVLR